MSNWSVQETLHFLECYQTKPCIWNPLDNDHKDKHKINDAWNHLSEILNKPVKELKSKKEILMVTFRKHLKKKRDSIRSGSGADDIHEPTWFAYQLMESFLLPVYTSKMSLNSETQSRSSETALEEMVDAEEPANDNSLAGPSTSAAAVSAPFVKKNSSKSRRQPASDLAEQQMATAFSQLTNVLSQRQPSDAYNEDECDLYAKLLAKKIRELPKDDRKLIMYEIDGLFIQKIKRRSFSRDTPSPQYFPSSRPSSASGGYILPNRPPGVQSSFSEPYFTSHYTYIERSSTPLQPPMPHNIDENIYSDEPNSSNTRPTVNIISDEVIIPPRHNIINTAFLKAYEDFEQNNTSE